MQFVMGRSSKLGINIALFAIGNFGSKILVFFLVPLYTAYLTTSEFGIAEIIAATISLLAPILTLSITQAMMRFCLDPGANHKGIFTTCICVQGIGFLLLLLFSPAILFFDVIRPYYGLFILYYFSFVTYQCFMDYARGVNKVVLYTISGICQTLVLVVSNVVTLCFLKTGIEGYLSSFCISYLAAATLLFVAGRYYQDFKGEEKLFDKDLCKELLSYSVPMIPNTVSWWVSNSSSKYILAVFCTTSTLGLFSVAYKIPTILSLCNSIFMSAWVLAAVDDFGSDGSKKFYALTFKRISSLLFVIAGFLITFNDTLAMIMYSKDFYAARIYVPILTLAVMVHAFGEFYGSIYTSSKKTKMLFYSSFWGAVINVVANFLLIPVLDAIGSAIAAFLSYSVILFIRGIHTRKIMRFNIEYRHILLSMGVLVFMCLLQGFMFDYGQYVSILLLLFLLVINHGAFKDAYMLIKNRIHVHR